MVLMLLSAGDARGEDILSFIDIRAYSMGKSSAALPTAANPAGVSLTRQGFASLGYVNRFALKELSSYSGCVAVPTRVLDFTAYLARFGMDAYNENKVSLAVSRRLTSRFALGVRVNYYVRQLADRDKNVHALTADVEMLVNATDKLKNVHALTADVEMLVNATDKLTIGVVVNNPLRKGIVKGKTGEKLPVSFAVGVTYQPLPTLLLTTEVEKSTSSRPWYKVGVEYSPITALDIRAGFLGAPFVPTFGIGVNFASFTVNAGAKWHTSLGPELMCGIDYTF